MIHIKPYTIYSSYYQIGLEVELSEFVYMVKALNRKPKVFFHFCLYILYRTDGSVYEVSYSPYSAFPHSYLPWNYRRIIGK